MAGQELIRVLVKVWGEADLAEVRGEWSRVSAGTHPANPPLVSTPFVFAHAAPHARILSALHRPLQAGLDHRAAQAHTLGLVDLEQRRAGVSDGEEQFRIYLTAGGVVAPVHAVHSSMTAGPSSPDPLHAPLVNDFTSYAIR